MERECDKYPAIKHSDCGPNNHEKFIAKYLEAQGLQVERLCKAGLPEREKPPDFRIDTVKQEIVLCEVKALTVSTGALTKSDWEYANARDYELLKKLAEQINVKVITTSEERKRLTGQIPYPVEGRNTEHEEGGYLKDITERLRHSEFASERLRVDIHRYDPFIWTDKEKNEFCKDLINNLELIGRG